MAATLFCCGLECGFYDSTNSFDVHFRGTSSAITVSTSTVRSGSRSLRVNPAAANTVIAAVASGAINSRVGRLYLRFATLPSSDCALIELGTSGTRGRVSFVASDNTIRAASNGGGTAASGIAVTTGIWYRIDWKWDDSADTMDVRVDGVAAESKTGVTATFTPGCFIGTQGTSVTADLFVDDIVISDTLADYPIGAGFGRAFVPTSDGTHNIAGTADFQRGNTAVDILNATTTAWQLVDDAPLPSGAVAEADCWRAVAPVNATDYPESIFGPVDGLAAPTYGPQAVEVILAHHQIATGAGSMDVLLNDNGTTDAVLTLSGTAGVVTYRYARKHYADPPSAATAWGVASGNGNFNNVRARFRSADANPDQCLDAIMIEADFPYKSMPPPLQVPRFIPRRRVR